MKELSQELLKRTSVLFILIGAILFLLGVAGGIVTGFFSLPISDVVGRVATGLVGLALVGLGMYLAWRDERQRPDEAKDMTSKEKGQAILDQMTWDEVWKKLSQLAVEVKQEPFNPDLIVGMARSGSLVASLFALNFRYKPFCALDRVPTEREPREKGDVEILDTIRTEFIKGKRILLIDAECTTGKTLKAAKEFLLKEKLATEVRTMVIGKNAMSSFRPDYVAFQFQKGPRWPWVYTEESKRRLEVWRNGHEYNE